MAAEPTDVSALRCHQAGPLALPPALRWAVSGSRPTSGGGWLDGWCEGCSMSPSLRRPWAVWVGVSVSPGPTRKERTQAENPAGWRGPTRGRQRTASQATVTLRLKGCPLSRVQLFYDPMDCSPTGSSVHGIFQARIMGWVATPSSRGSS